ncbi:MAG: choice-of-anchor V domain-containing protein [Thermoplasmatota archaeon]
MRGALLVIALVATAAVVDATFASAVGFSGRHADCTVCHMPAPQAATAHLDAPAAWRPGETYDIQASVSGGPQPLLPFRPQGGFELEADVGQFLIAPEDAELFRTPRDQVITYEPAGTAMRSWSFQWQAPPVWQEPLPVTFWLAAMAANGDHDAQLNRSDGGERGDAVDTLSVTIPADPEAVAAWRALPLEPPRIQQRTATETGWRLEGEHGDENATHLVVTRGDTQRRIPTEANWVIDVEGNLDIVLHAEGAGRRSPDVDLDQDVQASAPLAGPAAVLVLAAAARRFK